MISAVGGAMLLTAGVVFLAREGLERASWWAGLGAFLVTVVSAAVAVTRARVRQSSTDPLPSASSAAPDAPSPADGGDDHQRHEPIQRTGDVQQRNSGGVNIANTGTIGRAEVRTDGGTNW
ncbi:hypothetical protein SAMN05443287_11839 [Micromonospora phaseoli]|uniref:Uncharacterized protein n=2 Tax=Micromonospora phaseoli TaxID=1144548 RepID=A0A1H7DXA8_9ACTN|nr:hypothetical protein CLV64_11617 [Micromonospora phaseoli]GIJ80557.1 hypothetical protein Xph01_49890 [Micromonospora phaseoli]SEK05457.1 hypothetical protein SAMN05443287_11839 [Micromonospora phaseoli]